MSLDLEEGLRLLAAYNENGSAGWLPWENWAMFNGNADEMLNLLVEARTVLEPFARKEGWLALPEMLAIYEFHAKLTSASAKGGGDA